MVKEFHRVAQYLATMSKSFLEPKADDSHTNLGWKDNALHTHPLTNDNDVFSFDYESFSLIWSSNSSVKQKLLLDGKTHIEIMNWLNEVSSNENYKYDLHYELPYELPYEQITDKYIFNKPKAELIIQLINNRNLVQNALQNVLKFHRQDVPIRIWPHHFDSGSFITVSTDVGIGLGMAVPDSIIDNFYLYVSGYKGHNAISLSDFAPLKYGRYYDKGWKGFAFSVSELSTESAINFYKEAIGVYLSNT